MRKLAQLTHWLLVLYLCGIVAIAAVAVGQWKWQHLRLLSAQTNSMAPLFRHGDAVLIKAVATGGLQVGQIVSYFSPKNPSVLVSHRIVAIDERTGLLTTKGDNLAKPDVPFGQGLVIGQVTSVLPKVGYLLDFLRRPIGLIAAIYVPAAAIIASEAKRLARHYVRGYYRLLSFHG